MARAARRGLRDELSFADAQVVEHGDGPRDETSTRWLPMKPARRPPNERITSPPAYRKNSQFAELQGAFGRELRSRTKRARS